MSFGRAIGAALAIVCCLTGCDSTPPTPAEKKRQEQFNVDADAAVTAQGFVKQYLQYPHDASFPWTPATVTRNDEGNIYSVFSTVAAKNTFGAELTHEWGVVMLRTEDQQWELLSCAIGDETVYRSAKLDELLAERREAAAEQAQLEQIGAANPPEPEPVIKVHPRPKPPPEPESETKPIAEVQPPPKPLPKPEPEWRTWTSADGQYTVEAEFVSFAMGDVKLRKKDGKTVTLKMKKLSEADQEWIRKKGRRY